jgi:hypothetical protein
MTAQPLPALASGDPSAWDQALYAFLVEKGNRSGSRRTVESYGRMLWPFFADLGKTPDRVKPADVLAFVHGIGKSGRTPSATTVGARIACLSSFYRFLIRMPVLAQLGGIALDDGVVARVVAALGSTARPVAIDRSRIERQMRELALEHVGGGISDETYLERMKRLRASLAEIEETAQVGVPADRAVEWLRALAATWQQADVPEARSELLHAIYERIVIAEREFVSARLTSAAYAHGLALALPENVAMARPTLYPLSYGRATPPSPVEDDRPRGSQE